MRTIALVNQQGGVGKTATVVNLGHALARRGYRTLIVDLDPQGHLATCLGIFRPPASGSDAVLIDGDTVAAQRVSSRELMDLLPAGRRLAQLEGLGGGCERASLLREALYRETLPYDYALFDCPPSAGMLVANALLAVDDILVPMAGDCLSLTGLAKLMANLQRLEDLRDKPLHRWIFLNRFVARRRLSQEVMQKLLEHFSGQLLQTTVREAAVIAESAGAGRTVFEYRSNCKSATEFGALCDDLLQQRLMDNEQKRTSHVA